MSLNAVVWAIIKSNYLQTWSTYEATCFMDLVILNPIERAEEIKNNYSQTGPTCMIWIAFEDHEFKCCCLSNIN